jgi:thioredoxin-like negative regulator of GroEL
MKTIRHEDDGKWTIQWVDKPDSVNLIDMDLAKKAIHEQDCLLLFIAVWSGPDLKALEILAEMAEELKERFFVGVYAFDGHVEISKEFGMQEKYKSPIWAMFKQGKTMFESSGLKSSSEIRQKLDEATNAGEMPT